MPPPADRRRTERMRSNTRLNQLDPQETIRRARAVRAESRRLIEQARQVRETTAITAGVPARSDLWDTARVTRCALCRTPIAPTSLKRVVKGESYHSGCWDRKVRQEAEKTKSG
jgi:deoxycytidylate deaminase